MPFYRLAEMADTKDLHLPTMHKHVAGELIKVGVVTYQEGEGPPPHFHPNEEQFVLMLEGKMRMVLDGEVKVVERGDLIHIPRNTEHGIKVVEGPAVFFTCKSPVGSGELSLDYNEAPNVEKLKETLAGD